jgi:hypothetical protein
MEDFYVTFGVQYGQSVNSERHPLRMQKNGYAVIEAVSLDAAHRIAGQVFGTAWAFVYDHKHFIADGTAAKWHHDGELMRIKPDGTRVIVNEEALQGGNLS